MGVGGPVNCSRCPSHRVTNSEDFSYAGHQSFDLYGIAHAEQHFFVDADDQGHIERLYWIQFEGYLPSNSYSYQYKITKQVNLGGLTFIADTFARNSVDAEKNRPESDLGKAEAFLEDKGYQIERNDFVLQRLVHLIGKPPRNELMIIYAEDFGEHRATVSDIVESGSATAQSTTLSQELLERAAENMTVSP